MESVNYKFQLQHNAATPIFQRTRNMATKKLKMIYVDHITFLLYSVDPDPGLTVLLPLTCFFCNVQPS